MTERKASKSKTLRGAWIALATAVVNAVVGLLWVFDVIDGGEAAMVAGLLTPLVTALGALMARSGRLNPGILPIVVLFALLAGCSHDYACKRDDPAVSYLYDQAADVTTLRAPCQGDEDAVSLTWPGLHKFETTRNLAPEAE